MGIVSRAQALHAAESPLTRRRRGQAARAFVRTPTAIAGMVLVIAWVIIALTVSLWAPYSPIKQEVVNRLHPPSAQHVFGTDYLGRDVFSRVLYGSRISLPVAILVSLASLAAGSLIGAAAGFSGGVLDDLAMRVADITLAFPSIVLAMAIITAAGPGLTNAMIAMLIVGWPQYARLMRAQVLTVKEQEHVVAARAIGAPESRVLTHHVVPLCIGPLIVAVTLDMGNVLLLASALSFIGLGAVPPQPEWGLMVAEGRTKFLQWWISGFAGLAIMSMVLGFNFIGDSLRDALDPRTRTRD